MVLRTELAVFPTKLSSGKWIWLSYYYSSITVNNPMLIPIYSTYSKQEWFEKQLMTSSDIVTIPPVTTKLVVLQTALAMIYGIVALSVSVVVYLD